LTVLRAVALSGQSAREVDTRLPPRRPRSTLSIFNRIALRVCRIVARHPHSRFDQVPIMRGRITLLNGACRSRRRQLRREEAQWALAQRTRPSYGRDFAARFAARGRALVAARLPRSAARLVRCRLAQAWLQCRGSLTVSTSSPQFTAASPICARSIGSGWASTLPSSSHLGLSSRRRKPISLRLLAAAEEKACRAVTERSQYFGDSCTEAFAAVESHHLAWIGDAVRLTALRNPRCRTLVLGWPSHLGALIAECTDAF